MCRFGVINECQKWTFPNVYLVHYLCQNLGNVTTCGLLCLRRYSSNAGPASEREETSDATVLVVFGLSFSSVSSLSKSFSLLIKLSNATILQSFASSSACESASFLSKVDMFSKKDRLSCCVAFKSCRRDASATDGDPSIVSPRLLVFVASVNILDIFTSSSPSASHSSSSESFLASSCRIRCFWIPSASLPREATEVRSGPGLGKRLFLEGLPFESKIGIMVEKGSFQIQNRAGDAEMSFGSRRTCTVDSCTQSTEPHWYRQSPEERGNRGDTRVLCSLFARCFCVRGDKACEREYGTCSFGACAIITKTKNEGLMCLAQAGFQIQMLKNRSVLFSGFRFVVRVRQDYGYE